EPAPLDVLVHDGTGNGLERRQLARRSAAVRAVAPAGRTRLAALTARAVLDRRCVHERPVPVVPGLVTPRQPACGAAPPARGSRCPRSCPYGGRIRAPSARRERDPAPPPVR